MAEEKTMKDIKAKIADKEAATLPAKPTKKQKELSASKELKAEKAANESKQETTEVSGDVEPAEAPKATAKAGKRSAKGLKESAEKQAKAEKQTTGEDEQPSKPKQPVTPTRSKLERRGKKYREAAKLIEEDKTYGVKEAVELAIKTSTVSFDASLELHVRLGVDPRHADQNVRDTVVLPAGTGKDVRVAVFADADGVKAAKTAGADIAGSEEFLQQLDKEVIDFDVLICQPQLMPKLGKYARMLGPKGLMPNPKSGTVATDVAKAVKEAKAGRVEYRVDSYGIIHVAFGKVSFGAGKLETNLQAIIASIKGNKPSSIKSTYVNGVHLTSSMGPSIPVEISALQ